MSSSAGRDEDVQHLGRADAVDDLHPGARRGTRARSRGCSGSPALTQRRSEEKSASGMASMARYAVGAVNSTVAPYSASAGAEHVRRAAFEQQGRRADPHREQHERAEAEGEPDRRRADEQIVRGRLAARARRTCRRPRAGRGGSAWSAFGRPVVPEVKARIATSSAAVSTAANSAGCDRRRSGRRGRRPMTQRRARGRPRSSRRRTGSRRCCTATPRDLVDRPQLGRAQRRHRGDRDPAGLQHGEPRRDQPLRCSASRSSTRLPGTTPSLVDQMWASRSTRSRSSP